MMPKEVMDEEEKEKPEEEQPEEKERAPQKPAAPVISAALFNRLVRVWAVATLFFAAATIYYLAPSGSFLWKSPLAKIPLGEERQLTIRPMLLVAAAVFGAGVWLLFKKFRGTFDYRKPGQGRWVRLCCYLGAGALAFFGAAALHGLLFGEIQKESAWLYELWTTELAGVSLTLSPIFFPAAAVFTGLLLTFHLYFNRPTWAEFLIETQSEMRKVSWPPRREWIGSTLVVIIVTACISLFLFGVDSGLSWLMRELKIGF